MRARVPETKHLDHRYFTRWLPLFSCFFCLLLSTTSPSCASFPRPWIPLLTPITVVYPNHAEYSGTTIHSHHALSPNMHTAPIHPHVQYKTSHKYSVKPDASRSSPA